MTTTRPRLAALGLAVAGVLLSGCGSAQPGVAAQVGDEEITVSTVDSLAESYCEAFEEQFRTNGQTVPNRYLRGGILGILARRSIAEQVADEYGVAPGDVYDRKRSQVEQSVVSLDEDLRESVVLVETGADYVEAIAAAVGERLLREEGVTGAKYSEEVARGQQAIEDWTAANGVDLDPQYGVELVDGQVAPVDTALSFPVSDTAANGAAEQPDPAYAASLPDSQRCG